MYPNSFKNLGLTKIAFTVNREMNNELSEKYAAISFEAMY